MVDLALHRQPGIGRQQMRHAFGRAMGAVSRGKGVIDIEIAEPGQRRCKSRVIGFLAGLKTGVLQQQNIAIAHIGDGGSSIIPDQVIDKINGLAEQVSERLRHRLQRQTGDAATLGATEMRQQDYFRAGFAQEINGRQGRLQTGIVGDDPILHRHVEIDAHEHALAGQFSVLDTADRRHDLSSLKRD